MSLFNCPHCEEIFGKPLSLQLHILFDHNGQRTCTVCNSDISSSEEMIKHVEKIGHQQKQCHRCGKGVANTKLLLKHLDGIHNPAKTYSFICEVCGTRFFDIYQLTAHYNWHLNIARPRRFHCTQCKKSYSFKHHLVKHLKKAHQIYNNKTETAQKPFTLAIDRKPTLQIEDDDEVITCQECGAMFKNVLSLSHHRRWKHVIKDFGQNSKREVTKHADESKYMLIIPTVTEKPYVCNLCQADFKRSDHCIVHLFKTHSIKLRDHKSLESKECTICGKHLKSSISLKSHMALHQKHPQGKLIHSGKDRKQFKCPICNLNVEGVDVVREHLRIEHPGSKEAKLAVHNDDLFEKEASNASNVSCDRNKCIPCTTLFPTVIEKDQHDENVHKKEIKCLLCAKSFSREVECRNHEETCHEDFPCRLCSIVSSCAKDYHSHFEKYHLKLPYICEFCGKLISAKEKLKNHYYFSHTGQENKPLFRCEFCHAKFKTDKAMEEHKIKTCRRKSRSKKFSCKICGDNFGFQQAFAKHMENTHNTLADVKCQLCCMLFFNEKGLKAHLRKAHSKTEERDACNSHGETEPENEPTSKGKAGKSAKAKNNVSELKYSCPRCNLKIKNVMTYNYHIQKHHFKQKKSPGNSTTKKTVKTGQKNIKTVRSSPKIENISQRLQRKSKNVKCVPESSNSETSETWDSDSE